MSPHDQPNTHLVPARELNVVVGKLSDADRMALPDRFSKLFLAHLERAAADSTLVCPRVGTLHKSLRASQGDSPFLLVCVEETRQPGHPAPVRVVTYHANYHELIANVIHLAEGGGPNTIYYTFYLWAHEFEKELRGWFVPLKVAAPHHWFAEFQSRSECHHDLSHTLGPTENADQHDAMLKRLALEFAAVSEDPLGRRITWAAKAERKLLQPSQMPTLRELEALSIKVAHHIELDLPHKKRTKGQAVAQSIIRFGTAFDDEL